MAVTEGRWTCPEPTCQETLVRSSLTSQEKWAEQLRIIQQLHGTRHAKGPYDQGGFLPIGMTTAVNATGEPERVVRG